MTTKELYQLANRLTRMEHAGRIDEATYRDVMGLLPEAILLAEEETYYNGLLNGSETYYWLSDGRWQAAERLGCQTNSSTLKLFSDFLNGPEFGTD